MKVAKENQKNIKLKHKGNLMKTPFKTIKGIK